MTEKTSLIPARLKSAVVGGHVTGAADIIDDDMNKTQAAINASINTEIGDDETEGSIKGRIKDLEESIGPGGSVEEQIQAAIAELDATESQIAGTDGLALSVTEVDGVITGISGSIATNTYDSYGAASTVETNLLGDAGTDYNTLGKLEDAIQAETSARETEIGTDSTSGTVKGRIKSLETLVGSTSVDSQIDTKINALDVTKSQTAGADGLALSIEEENGKIKSISGSIAANTYDAYGAASTAKTELLGDAAADYNTLGKLEDAIQTEATTRGNADTALDGRLDAVEEVIPSAATSTNQLADKSFVNSSISTATATFRGTSATGLTETEFLTWADTLTKDNNDYVFWNTADAAGTPQFKKYKYNGTTWVYEYTLNNSSFTADQWATINSLLTSAHKTKLDALPTNAELNTLLAGKVDTVTGKGLSTNDYTTNEKNKLAGIAAGAEVNVQSDWNATSGDAFIKNKPTIPDSFQWFGTSSTAADTVQKEVSIPSITSLKTGQIIVVQPTVTSTAADSTLKLNSFDAYPMRYNNAAITTSTDSTVWSANFPSLFVFDGSYWVFLGHGVDLNTTYSTMSVAEGTAGTATSARTMRADYLKQIIQAWAPQSDWNATSGNAVILNKPTIPSEVTESTVSGWGFTKNAGTITGIKMNGSSKGTSGVVDLGTVITAHQDISKKVDKTTTVNGHALSGNVSVTKSDVGLGNVGNFKAVSTVASQGLTDTEKSNARANIGAGTSSFSGSYNDLSNKPTIPAAAKNGTYTVKTLVGSTTTNVSDFTANQNSADDVTFVQGSNVTITPDAKNRKITIAAKDTTYSVMGGSGASHASGLVPDPGATQGNTKFLREDGTWQEVSVGSGFQVTTDETTGTDIFTALGTATITHDDTTGADVFSF